MKGLNHPAFLVFGSVPSHILACQQMDLAIPLAIASSWVLGCFHPSSLSNVICKLSSRQVMTTAHSATAPVYRTWAQGSGYFVFYTRLV